MPVTSSRPLGRDEVLARLDPLPACVLIRAPASTGKRTCAFYAARAAGVSGMDLHMWPQPYTTRDEQRVEPALSVGMVRELAAWCREAPHTPAGKYAVIRLDQVRRFDSVDGGSVWTASEACQHALLKLLEEPPRTSAGPVVRFALLASGGVGPEAVLPTVASRATAVTAGLLGTDTVAAVLYATTDMDRDESRAAAALGGGRVAPALARRRDAARSREAVVSVLHELSIGDDEALAVRARVWSAADTEMLVVAAHEAVSREFRCFDASTLAGFQPRSALAVLRTVSTVVAAHPRLVLGHLSGLAK